MYPNRLATAFALLILGPLALLVKLVSTIWNFGLRNVPSAMREEWRSVAAYAIYVATGREVRWYGGQWMEIDEIARRRRAHYFRTER